MLLETFEQLLKHDWLVPANDVVVEALGNGEILDQLCLAICCGFNLLLLLYLMGRISGMVFDACVFEEDFDIESGFLEFH